MINKVYTILDACNVPLDYNKRPNFDDKGIVLSYHFFNESAETFIEGEDDENSGTLQVDLFAKHGTDFTDVKKQIKQLLKANGFLSPRFNDNSEDVVGIGFINHVVIISNYLESEVL